MTPEEFMKEVKKRDPKDYGMCPPSTEADFGLHVLIHHFLGEDWYCVSPIHAKQVNTVAIYEILQKYPRRKPIKRKIKNLMKRIGEWIVDRTT